MRNLTFLGAIIVSCGFVLGTSADAKAQVIVNSGYVTPYAAQYAPYPYAGSSYTYGLNSGIVQVGGLSIGWGSPAYSYSPAYSGGYYPSYYGGYAAPYTAGYYGTRRFGRWR